MFDGVPVEQFHQFISTPSSRSIPPNSSFIQTPPISTSTNLNFLSTFDPLLFPPPLLPHQTLFQSNHFVPTPPTHINDTEGKADQDDTDINDSWSDDEVIQLLRIKSSSENWYRDFTWDHVSRKLAEVGYKRSAEKCKEKFEEESFSSSIGRYNSNSRYLISEEVDKHLFVNSNSNSNSNNGGGEKSSGHDLHVSIEPPVNHRQGEEEKGGGHFEKEVQIMRNKNKRKRKHRRLKMVKGLCVELVNKMMAQQEEMHKKLLEEMANRDEEREEAWRKGEMERLKREIQIREQEQEMARDRQSTINKLITSAYDLDQKLIHIPHIQPLTETETETETHQPAKDDGKRWPREEVLALISVRNSTTDAESSYSINGNKGAGGSLWERISQGMLELGYKRSAKRCKEKWENINKYFRKTKDANRKKRSLDSRTCPYYHELSKLYNQEKLAASASNWNIN